MRNANISGLSGDKWFWTDKVHKSKCESNHQEKRWTILGFADALNHLPKSGSLFGDAALHILQ
jgi:hypothetical protein